MTPDEREIGLLIEIFMVKQSEKLPMQESLGFPTSFSVGFAMAFPEMEDDVRKHPSVLRYSENRIIAKSSGTSLGKSVRDMKLDDEALRNMISEVVSTIASRKLISA